VKPLHGTSAAALARQAMAAALAVGCIRFCPLGRADCLRRLCRLPAALAFTAGVPAAWASRRFRRRGVFRRAARSGIVARRLCWAGCRLRSGPGLRHCRRRGSVGAEDQAHGRVLAVLRPVLAGVVEVKVHLSGVGMGELAEFEIDHHEAPEHAVEE
jgi:hypothetical protein